MERPCERVYTVMDFYDGPRSGFADFEGRPHAYRALWDVAEDDFDAEGRFALVPITPELLALALEDWAIWKRWENAFYAGEVPLSHHPALPTDRLRHEELAPVIAQALEILPAHGTIARGVFRARPGVQGNAGGRGPRPELEVQWMPI
jgi:hypothetical protein